MAELPVADLKDAGFSLEQITGGSVDESFLVKGVCFKKTFSYAGFEQQPKKFENPQIAILNVELELKAEKRGGGDDGRTYATFDPEGRQGSQYDYDDDDYPVDERVAA